MPEPRPLYASACLALSCFVACAAPASWRPVQDPGSPPRAQEHSERAAERGRQQEKARPTETPATPARVPQAPPPREAEAKQEYAFGPQPGSFVASFGGSLTRTSMTTTPRTNTAAISVTLRGGYYLTRTWEVGLQGIGTWSLPETGQDTILLGVEPYANYNLQVGERTWLFAGPQLGLLFIDTSGFEDTAFAVGGHLGMRHWISERTSFFTEGRYTFSRLELPSQDVDHHETELVFGVDVGF